MKHIILINILTLILAFSANCQTISEKEKDENKQTDSITLKASYHQKDTPINDYLTNELKPIRENFKKLNSIENWTKIKVIDLWETTEGGKVKFYFKENKLKKIITRDFGETFQILSEYYLKNGELSFVFEKLYRYNRPFYYDAQAKKENNDTEKFDFDKSEIIETRSYFKDEELLHQINNQDCGSPFAKEYLLEEQKRLLERYNELIKIELEE